MPEDGFYSRKQNPNPTRLQVPKATGHAVYKSRSICYFSIHISEVFSSSTPVFSLRVPMAGQLYFFFPTDFYYPKPPSVSAENANNLPVPSLHIPKSVDPQQPKTLVHREVQYEKVEKQPPFSPVRCAGSSHAKGRVKNLQQRRSWQMGGSPFLIGTNQRRAFQETTSKAQVSSDVVPDQSIVFMDFTQSV